MKTNIIQSTTLVLFALLLFTFSSVKIPLLDRHAEAYFTKAIQKAGLAYATARIINASVSVIKESQLQLEPGGVGISLAVGQVVDPIDDLTERLSDVLVTAISSLAVQRLLYEIGVSVAPVLLAFLLVILSILVWLTHWKIDKLRKMFIGISVIVVVSRFFLPASSLLNDYLYHHFFLEDINEARQGLALATREIEQLKEIHLPQTDGIAGTIKNSTTFLKHKTIQFKNALVAISQNMGEIIGNLLKLTWLYIGILFLQVIALPILMFWLLIKLFGALFSMNIPTLLSGASTKKAAAPKEAP